MSRCGDHACPSHHLELENEEFRSNHVFRPDEGRRFRQFEPVEVRMPNHPLGAIAGGSGVAHQGAAEMKVVLVLDQGLFAVTRCEVHERKFRRLRIPSVRSDCMFSLDDETFEALVGFVAMRFGEAYLRSVEPCGCLSAWWGPPQSDMGFIRSMLKEGRV